VCKKKGERKKKATKEIEVNSYVKEKFKKKKKKGVER
jgi:hypothetical protein